MHDAITFGTECTHLHIIHFRCFKLAKHNRALLCRHDNTVSRLFGRLNCNLIPGCFASLLYLNLCLCLRPFHQRHTRSGWFRRCLHLSKLNITPRSGSMFQIYVTALSLFCFPPFLYNVLSESSKRRISKVRFNIAHPKIYRHFP